MDQQPEQVSEISSDIQVFEGFGGPKISMTQENIERENESFADLAQTGQPGGILASGEKIAQKGVIRKGKVYIDNYTEFIPEFLLLLNQQKHKSVIRIGKNYQAEVPTRCIFSHKYRSLKQLQIWNSGEIPISTFKKYKEKFGENRTEEDLCLLGYQYGCEMGDLLNYVEETKGELRKYYVQRERIKQ